MMDAWRGADFVILIDAVHSGANLRHDLPHRRARGGNSALFFPLLDARVQRCRSRPLARALGQLPQRLVVFGIEGKNFESGIGLSLEIETAVEEAARRVKAELCPNSHL
jgi:hydrogenase maturation protease